MAPPATALGAVLIAIGMHRHRGVWVSAALMVVAAWAGWMGAERRAATLAAEVPTGPITMIGRVLDDPRPSATGLRFPLRPEAIEAGRDRVSWRGPGLAVYGSEEVVGTAALQAGDVARVTGRLGAGGGWLRGDPVAGRLIARSVSRVATAGDPLFRAGNLLRSRVHAGLERFAGRAEAGLLAGFLIGDVRALPAPDGEALRLAGLSHFVAVSGSNVALFLAAWWIAAGPLGWTPRRRALIGLAGLAVFVVVTRWEPSVVRAAVMAGLVLAGRLLGVALGPWTALGGAVTVLLLISPELIADVGFQLSVAATAGVVFGAGMFPDRRPRWAWTALAATISAQAAVAPLLLVHFGTVPLFAPLANVIAAPLVALSTSLGGIGVLTGLVPITEAGLLPARLVLGVARAAVDLPQLGAVEVSVGVGILALGLVRRLRPLVALLTAVGVAAVTLMPGALPQGSQLEVLDVGQGDAILLRDQHGTVVLVDGGPDGRLLRSELRRRGIRRIDLLVVTHQHADHVTGLDGLAEFVRVDRAWLHDEDEVLVALASQLTSSGSFVETPAVGWHARVGEFDLEVLGPRRRYAGPNDQSMVIRAVAGGTSVLLSGDIEVVAQRELGPEPADVLKVPHQGAATTDLDWLAASAPRIAVISVGPNDFGHPSPEVIETLERAGAVVFRTDRDGSVLIRLDEL